MGCGSSSSASKVVCFKDVVEGLAKEKAKGSDGKVDEAEFKKFVGEWEKYSRSLDEGQYTAKQTQTVLRGFGQQIAYAEWGANAHAEDAINNVVPDPNEFDMKPTCDALQPNFDQAQEVADSFLAPLQKMNKAKSQFLATAGALGPGTPCSNPQDAMSRLKAAAKEHGGVQACLSPTITNTGGLEMNPPAQLAGPANHLADYTSTAGGLLASAPDIQEKVTALVETAKELPDKAKEGVSGLAPGEAMKVMKNTTANVKRIGQLPTDLKSCMESCQDAVSLAKSMVS